MKYRIIVRVEIQELDKAHYARTVSLTEDQLESDDLVYLSSDHNSLLETMKFTSTTILRESQQLEEVASYERKKAQEA